MKKKIFLHLLLFIVLFLLLAVTPAYAITLRSTEEKLTIPSEETIQGDLYASSGNVEIEGKVNGDAIVGGGTVTIDGVISGDLIAAGGAIFLNGEIKDDVRIAGGTLYVNGKIGGDIIAAGGQVKISKKSRINENALIGCGTLQIDGPIGKNLWAGAGTVALDGRIGENAKISSDDISLGSSAKIYGNLLYFGSKKAKIDSGARVRGRVTHELPPEEAQKAAPFAGLVGILFYVLFAFISFLAALITAFIIIALFPKAVAETLRILTESLWTSLGVGFLALIAVPVAAIILIFTLVGLPLGVISFALYFIFIYLSQIIFGIFLGKKILVGATKSEGVSPYLSALVGIIIIAVLGFIPFLGWLVKFVVMLFGIGALVLATFKTVQRAKEPIASTSSITE